MILVLICVSVVFPLKYNIDTKITNHIFNKELCFNVANSENADETLSEIKKVDNVVDVYPSPLTMDVSDDSKALKGSYTLSYFHKGFEPTITDGKAFDENTKGVAVVPKNIKDLDNESGKLTELDGRKIIGKTLDLSNNYFDYKVKVVGVYDDTDLIFDDNQIIIPREELLRLNELSPEIIDTEYIVTVNDVNNVEKAMKDISELCYVNINGLGIDANLYSIAVYILLLALLVFVVLAVAGCYIFLKYNISHRVNEFALYRAIGYKTMHIFYLVFTEYFLISSLAIVITVVASNLLCTYLVNPYVQSFLAGSIIRNMNVNVDIIEMMAVIITFFAILLFVCTKFVKQTEKIDLTVLLNE